MFAVQQTAEASRGGNPESSHYGQQPTQAGVRFRMRMSIQALSQAGDP
jgi:hypothetical protein